MSDEEKLKVREEEEFYRALFKNNHAVMLLINPETGDIIDANPAACSFYGYDQDELLSMKIWDINILPKDQLSEEWVAPSRAPQLFPFSHRLATGETRDVEVYSGPIGVRDRRSLFHNS